MTHNEPKQVKIARLTKEIALYKRAYNVLSRQGIVLRVLTDSLNYRQAELHSLLTTKIRGEHGYVNKDKYNMNNGGAR